MINFIITFYDLFKFFPTSIANPQDFKHSGWLYLSIYFSCFNGSRRRLCITFLDHLYISELTKANSQSGRFVPDYYWQALVHSHPCYYSIQYSFSWKCWELSGLHLASFHMSCETASACPILLKFCFYVQGFHNRCCSLCSFLVLLFFLLLLFRFEIVSAKQRGLGRLLLVLWCI